MLRHTVPGVEGGQMPAPSTSRLHLAAERQVVRRSQAGLQLLCQRASDVMRAVGARARPLR